MNAKNNPILPLIAKTLPTYPLTIFTPTNAILNSFKKTLQENKQCHIKAKPYLNFTTITETPFANIVGPAIGAPAAVLCLEPFLQNKNAKIIFLGTCGGISHQTEQEIRIGDFILPSGAISEEGTSRHYGGLEEIPYALNSFQEQLEKSLKKTVNAQEHQPTVAKGKVWTTDVPYLEDESKVASYKAKGAIAVDMEFSAILQLCSSYSIPFASVLIVSDIVSGDKKSGLRSPTLKRSLALANSAILALLKKN